MMRFATSDRTIDVAALRAELHNPSHGGFCAFEGWVRDRNDGRAVDGLEYEIFEALARTEGDRILVEARERFGAIDAIGVHRSGSLAIGEMAVWVGVSSAHRDAAFRACRFIIDQIKHRLPVWKKERYLDGDTAWVACAHPPGDDHHHHASAPAPFVPDYSRQLRLPGVGEAGQARLAGSAVLVIGAGGLGSPVLSYLAGAGVGRLGIVDPDRVEASNLHRQVLYGVEDIGLPKVEAAQRRIAAINPAVSCEPFPGRLGAQDAVDVFRRFDLVLDCSDDPSSRMLTSDASVLSGTPAILAAVHQHEGQMQVIRGGGAGACLRCLWPEEPATIGSCAESGVLGPVPGVLGAMQGNEALKLLLGIGPVADGLLLVDLLENESRRLRIDPAEGCDTRGGCVAVAETALGGGAVDRRFASLRAAREAGFVLVDLRDAGERAALPFGEDGLWLPAPDLVVRAGELPEGERVLLVCASGRRSAQGARTLRAAGRLEVFSLAGGINGLAQG